MKIFRNFSFALLGLMVSVASHSASTTFKAANDTLTLISGWLTSFGAVIITIALMIAGYRLAFTAAQLKDLGPLVYGGVIAGSAAFVAGAIFTGT